MRARTVTICGVYHNELQGNICTKCGLSCEIRKQDWVDERVYNFCKLSGCLVEGEGTSKFNRDTFIAYLRENPNEIRSRLWLQAYAKQLNIPY